MGSLRPDSGSSAISAHAEEVDALTVTAKVKPGQGPINGSDNNKNMSLAVPYHMGCLAGLVDAKQVACNITPSLLSN